MPRLPASMTEQEKMHLMERLLREAWGRIDTAEDPESFFRELGAIIGAEVSLPTSTRIAEAMAGYFYEMKGALDAQAMSEARRFVRGVRREIADMRKRLVEVERKLASAKGDVVLRRHREHAGRECLGLYENIRQHRDQLDSLSGATVTKRRMAEARHAVWKAMQKVEPPFRYADCDGALAILDPLLERWADAFEARRGRSIRSRVLSKLIDRLQEIFEEVTGRRPMGRSRFQKFAMRILAALPAEVRNAGMVTDRALPRRVQRMLSTK